MYYKMAKKSENFKNETRPALKGDKQAISQMNTNMKTDVEISDEDIRKRAHEIFIERGGLPGSPEEDWFKAEEELKRKTHKAISVK